MSSGNIVKDAFDAYAAGRTNQAETIEFLSNACGWHDWVSFTINRWYAAWRKGHSSMLTLRERLGVLSMLARWGWLEEDERRFIALMYIESVDEARLLGAYELP